MKTMGIIWLIVCIGLGTQAAPKPKSSDTLPKRGKSLPIVLFTDSSFIKTYPETWRIRVKRLHDTTSACFEQQFAVHFELAKIVTVKMQRDTAITIDAAFNALVGHHYPGADTISILFYADPTIDTNAPIGETEFGRKQIALRERSYTDSSDIRGWAIKQGLALLHELGHSFGAIHVSDINSVMNHSPSPIGAFAYDTLNKQIIEKALRGDFAFVDHTMYLQTVSSLLQNSAYPLSDYPEFFNHYLLYDSTAAQQAINNPSYVTATFAFQLLTKGDSAHVKQLLDTLITADSSMAALWYYRGLATSEKNESNHYLKRAADAGYYLAQELLRIRETETPR
jgi:hypothetical protein